MSQKKARRGLGDTPWRPQGPQRQPHVAQRIPDGRPGGPRGAPEGPETPQCAKTIGLLHLFTLRILILTTVAHIRVSKMYKLSTLQAFCLIFIGPWKWTTLPCFGHLDSAFYSHSQAICPVFFKNKWNLTWKMIFEWFFPRSTFFVTKSWNCCQKWDPPMRTQERDSESRAWIHARFHW